MIECIVMTSREQRLITKEHIAMHTNLFLWFNSLNTQVTLVYKEVALCRNSYCNTRGVRNEV